MSAHTSTSNYTLPGLAVSGEGLGNTHVCTPPSAKRGGGGGGMGVRLAGKLSGNSVPLGALVLTIPPPTAIVAIGGHLSLRPEEGNCRVENGGMFNTSLGCRISPFVPDDSLIASQQRWRRVTILGPQGRKAYHSRVSILAPTQTLAPTSMNITAGLISIALSHVSVAYVHRKHKFAESCALAPLWKDTAGTEGVIGNDGEEIASGARSSPIPSATIIPSPLPHENSRGSCPLRIP